MNTPTLSVRVDPLYDSNLLYDPNSYDVSHEPSTKMSNDTSQEPSTQINNYLEKDDKKRTTRASTRLSSIRIVPSFTPEVPIAKSNHNNLNPYTPIERTSHNNLDTNALKNIFSFFKNRDLRIIENVSRKWYKTINGHSVIIPFKKTHYNALCADALRTIFSFFIEPDLSVLKQISKKWYRGIKEFGYKTAIKHYFPLCHLRSSSSYLYFTQKLSSQKLWKRGVMKPIPLPVPVNEKLFFRSFLSHGQYRIGGSIFGRVYLFEETPTRSFNLLHTFNLHRGCVDYLAIWDKFLITASLLSREPDEKDDRVFIINLETSVEKSIEIKDLTNGGRNPILNFNNGKLAIVENAINLVVYDILENKSKTFSSDAGPITCLANWKNDYVVMGHVNGNITIKNLNYGNLIAQHSVPDPEPTPDSDLKRNSIVDISVAGNKLFICDRYINVKAFKLTGDIIPLYSLSSSDFTNEPDKYYFARIQAWGNKVVTIACKDDCLSLFIDTWFINNPKGRITFTIPNYFKNDFVYQIYKFRILPVLDRCIIQPFSPVDMRPDQEENNRELLKPILLSPPRPISKDPRKKINAPFHLFSVLPTQIFSCESKTHTLASYSTTFPVLYEDDLKEEMSSFKVFDQKANRLELNRKYRAVHNKKTKFMQNILLAMFVTGIMLNFIFNTNLVNDNP